jgi:hypothetical protein
MEIVDRQKNSVIIAYRFITKSGLNRESWHRAAKDNALAALPPRRIIKRRLSCQKSRVGKPEE